jgi:hypothetical protein
MSRSGTDRQTDAIPLPLYEQARLFYARIFYLSTHYVRSLCLLSLFALFVCGIIKNNVFLYSSFPTYLQHLIELNHEVGECETDGHEAADKVRLLAQPGANVAYIWSSF